MFKDFVKVPITFLKEERDIHHSDEQRGKERTDLHIRRLVEGSGEGVMVGMEMPETYF